MKSIRCKNVQDKRKGTMITEQTRKRKIRSFAKDRAICWAKLEDFANRRCKPKER